MPQWTSFIKKAQHFEQRAEKNGYFFYQRHPDRIQNDDRNTEYRSSPLVPPKHHCVCWPLALSIQDRKLSIQKYLHLDVNICCDVISIKRCIHFCSRSCIDNARVQFFVKSSLFCIKYYTFFGLSLSLKKSFKGVVHFKKKKKTFC